MQQLVRCYGFVLVLSELGYISTGIELGDAGLWPYETPRKHATTPTACRTAYV